SIKPGATILPDTSTSRAPATRSISPTAVMRSAPMATSTRRRGRPVPSITSPPRKIHSVIRALATVVYVRLPSLSVAARNSPGLPATKRLGSARDTPGEQFRQGRVGKIGLAPILIASRYLPDLVGEHSRQTVAVG